MPIAPVTFSRLAWPEGDTATWSLPDDVWLYAPFTVIAPYGAADVPGATMPALASVPVQSAGAR